MVKGTQEITEQLAVWPFGILIALVALFLSQAYFYIYRLIETIDPEKLDFAKSNLPKGALVKAHVFLASHHTKYDYRYFDNLEVAKMHLIVKRRLGVTYGIMVVTAIAFSLLSFIRILVFNLNFAYTPVTELT